MKNSVGIFSVSIVTKSWLVAEEFKTMQGLISWSNMDSLTYTI